jgi:hypothetical protein
MGLDIRIPIAMLFMLLGAILGAYGVLGSQTIYEKSLGFDINLYWGMVLLAFGIFMGYLGKNAPAAPPSEGGTQPEGPPRMGH